MIFTKIFKSLLGTQIPILILAANIRFWKDSTTVILKLLVDSPMEVRCKK